MDGPRPVGYCVGYCGVRRCDSLWVTWASEEGCALVLELAGIGRPSAEHARVRERVRTCAATSVRWLDDG